MKDNFLLKQLAQAVVDSCYITYQEMYTECQHCEVDYGTPHKPHCIVLVAEQILKGDEE